MPMHFGMIQRIHGEVCGLANADKRPADGLEQSAYDFWLGRDGLSGTDEPTFSVNKFTLDGGNFAEVKNSNDFFKKNLRTDIGGAWWIASAYLVGAFDTTQTILGTTNGASTPGWRFDYNTTPNLRLIRVDGSANNAINLHSFAGRVKPFEFVRTSATSNTISTSRTALAMTANQRDRRLKQERPLLRF